MREKSGTPATLGRVCKLEKSVPRAHTSLPGNCSWTTDGGGGRSVAGGGGWGGKDGGSISVANR